MSVAENISMLRKRNGITQEQLADELGVSRQAVSKWETGEAFPETDKLIALCDKFGVNCDALLRGNVAAGEVRERDSESPDRNNERAEKRRIDRFSLMMAFGVGSTLLGVVLCVLLSGFGVLRDAKPYRIFGVACVFLFVAASVFLFVYGGITNENEKKAHPERRGVSAEDAKAFLRRYPLVMACLFAGVILLIVMLVLGFALFAPDGTKRSGFNGCVITAVFLAGLSVCVGGLCLIGIRRDGYKPSSEVSEPQTGKANESRLQRIAGGISGAIMLTATAVFLLCGFLGDLWHSAWVVFPIGGILCGIVNTVMQSFDKKN